MLDASLEPLLPFDFDHFLEFSRMKWRETSVYWSEGKCKLLVNIAMLVLLYGSLFWVDTINTTEYQITEIDSVHKDVLRYVRTLCASTPNQVSRR